MGKETAAARDPERVRLMNEIRETTDDLNKAKLQDHDKARANVLQRRLRGLWSAYTRYGRQERGWPPNRKV
jgi:hypothetical protein